jgi:hypothetical protein
MNAQPRRYVSSRGDRRIEVQPHQEEFMTVKEQSQPADTGATAQEKAQEQEKENEQAAEEMRELEAGDPPTNLDDWPDGPAKYLTYGSGEDEAYGAGVTGKLGPANLERNGEGSIVIDGEKVDNPDDYKSEPLAGGPTDPNATS